MTSQWDSAVVSKSFIFDPFHGSLIFSPHCAEITEFRKFMQTYNPSKYPEDYFLALLWNTHFNCTFSGPDCKILGNCLSNVSLEMLPRNIWEVDMTEESYNVYILHMLWHTVSMRCLSNKYKITPMEMGRKKNLPLGGNFSACIFY